MALRIGVAEAVFDNADADARIDSNGHGFGINWDFDEPRYHGGPGYDQTPWPLWNYGGGDCEYIPAIKGVGPRGRPEWVDMAEVNLPTSIGDWYTTLNSDMWKERKPFGSSNTTAMHYFDGHADQEGEIASKVTFGFHNVFRFLLSAPPQDQTSKMYIGIEMAMQATSYSFQFIIPILGGDTKETTSDVYKYMQLWRAINPDGYELLDEWQTGGARAGSEKQGPSELIVWWDFDADHCHISLDHYESGFVYYEKGLTDPANGLIARGPIRIKMVGITGFVQAAQVKFPDGATIETNTTRYVDGDYSPYLFVPAWINQAEDDIHVREIVDTPPSTTATGDYIYDGEVYQGQVAFTTTDPYQRAVCSLVQQYHDPVQVSGGSSEDTTEGDAQLLKLSGRVTDRWREASCHGELLASAGEWPHKGNEKVTAKATQDTGDTVTTVNQFTGYVTDPRKSRRGSREVGKARYEFEAEDGIAARLRHKRMLFHPSYGGWSLPDAFTYILQRCGITTDQIDVTAIPSDWILPTGKFGSPPLFSYAHDTNVVSALDSMIHGQGLIWGVDQDGKYFIKIRPAYSGTPDFTLDDDTATPADVIREITASRPLADRINHIAVFVGSGVEQASWSHYDGATLDDNTDPHFIGDDFWEVITDTEADPDRILAIADYYRTELMYAKHMLEWTTTFKEALFPDMFVKVATIENCDIPDDTVFRITEKRWEFAEGKSDGTCRFLGTYSEVQS